MPALFDGVRARPGFDGEGFPVASFVCARFSVAVLDSFDEAGLSERSLGFGGPEVFASAFGAGASFVGASVDRDGRADPSLAGFAAGREPAASRERFASSTSGGPAGGSGEASTTSRPRAVRRSRNPIRLRR